MFAKRNAKLCLLLIVIMASTLWFPPAAPGQEKKEAELKKKIADITIFSGEVMARTKMVWKQVDKTPYPLFSDDQVATKKGRAEIVFSDGGIMRLGLDSEVKISERKEEVGVIRKRIVAKRDVKVLLGEMTADMKKGPDQEITFRTPTMVAGIRGTQVFNEVSATGETKFGSSEAVDTTGNFARSDTVPSIDPRSTSGARDDARANHSLLQNADQATRQHRDANRLAQQAQTSRQAAAQAARTAQANRTPENQKSAANAMADAAEANVRAAEARTDATITTTQGMVGEANQFRDTAAAGQAQETLDRQKGEAQRTQALGNTVTEMANAARQNPNPQAALGSALGASTASNAASTATNVIVAEAHVANAQVDGRTEDVSAARQFVGNLQTIAQDSNKLVQNATTVLQQVSTAKTDAEVRTGLSILQATETATATANSAAIAVTNAVDAAASRDTEGLKEVSTSVNAATNLARQTAQIANNAQGLLQSVTQAQTKEGAETAARAAEAVANAAQTIANTASILANLTTNVIVGNESAATATADLARVAERTSDDATKAATTALELGIRAATAATTEEAQRLASQVLNLQTTISTAVTQTTDMANQATAEVLVAQEITGQAAIGTVTVPVTTVTEAAPTVTEAAPTVAEAVTTEQQVQQTTEEIQKQQQEQTQTETSTTGTQEEVRAKTPDITAVSEADIKGRIGDTIELKLTGINFTGSTVALPTGFEVLGFTVSSDTEILISARLKPEIAGVTTGDVRVTSPGGADTFSITIPPFPLITSMTENRLPLGEIISVSLEGKNFQQGMSLDFGPGVTVQSIIVVDSQHASVQLNVNVGATLGLRDVTITLLNGNSSLLSGGITVVLPPPPPPPTPSK